MSQVNTILRTTFKSCLNILREEGLTGDKALRNMSYLLVLKLIEPHLGKDINILDCDEYDFSYLGSDDAIEYHKTKLFEIVHFSKLAMETADNIPYMVKCLWDDVLSIHPTTCNIFLKNKGFDIKHQSTFKKLIDQLHSVDITHIDCDILGNAYEEVIQDVMVGKILGQFFTPKSVKNLLIQLINPQLHSDGTIETCCDPTMGTGGLLISYIQHLKKQSVANGIELDWDFIKSRGLYGKELEPDTYQLAVSNMLISSGHMFEKLDNGDSIRAPIDRKFDNILANPPFGIKGLNYDDFRSSIKDEYTPIKTNSAVPLFIQAIIYMLKIDGKCAVVMPNGEDLFSKTKKSLIAIREYLMKTCDLKEIIRLPDGIFTNTSIKTCVFYFVKKREGIDALTTTIKFSKTQKETGRKYTFTETLQTTSVLFYDYNPCDNVKTLLVEVPVETIVANAYSLNCADYTDKIDEQQYARGVVVKTLGDIFGEKTNNFININDCTKYNIIGLSSKGSSKISKQLLGSDIKIKKQQVCKLHQFALSKILNGCYGYINADAVDGIMSSEYWLFDINTDIILKKYVYYIFAIQIMPQLNQISNGVGIPRINKDKFYNLPIPIPSLDHQQQIVDYLDFIYETANKTSSEKIDVLKRSNELCLTNQRLFGVNTINTLGEVCSINYGTRIVKGNNAEGEYPVYGSGRAMFTTNTFNREGYNVLIGRFALSLECVRLINDKIFLNDSGLSVKPITDILLHEYIGYYLLYNKNIIYNCARGTAQKNLELDEFKSLPIPIPSLERQQQIVAYCEANDELIRQLEQEIERNKLQAKFYLESVMGQIAPESSSSEETKDTIE